MDVASIRAALPSGASLRDGLARASVGLERYVPALPSGGTVERLRGRITGGAAPNPADHAAPGSSRAPVNPGESEAEFTAMVAARRARIAFLKSEGPRMLHAGNARRAIELCRAWVDLDLGNADAWRCLGQAEQAVGEHQEALNAFRKARQHAPNDRSLDVAIEQAERGIITDFLNRYRR